MSNIEKQTVVITLVYAQLIIEQIDNLEMYTPFYRNKVKSLCKNLVHTLEPKIDRLIDGASAKEVSNQIIDISSMLMKHSLILFNIPEEIHEVFYKDFERIVRKHLKDKSTLKTLFGE